MFAANVVEKTFLLYEKSLSSPGESNAVSVPCVLSTGLLRNLVERLNAPKVWLDIFHRKLVLMSMVSHLHHCLRGHRHPEVAQALFSFLIPIAKSEDGCRALILTNLSQMLWLPLADIKLTVDAAWLSVFRLAINFACVMLRVGKHDAVDQSIDFVTVLQEQLILFLMAPQERVQTEFLDGTVATGSLIAHLMRYHQRVSETYHR